MPVVGYLNIGSTTMEDARMVSFQEGLREQGFVEGRNAVIESRYASTGDYEGLLALANDLVRLPVTVLFTTGSAGVARAARAATATIPIVFANGSDPDIIRSRRREGARPWEGRGRVIPGARLQTWGRPAKRMGGFLMAPEHGSRTGVEVKMSSNPLKWLGGGRIDRR